MATLYAVETRTPRMNVTLINIQIREAESRGRYIFALHEGDPTQWERIVRARSLMGVVLGKVLASRQWVPISHWTER